MAWFQHLCSITSLVLQISLFMHQSPWISNMGILHVLVTFMNWKVLFLLLLLFLNKKLHYCFLYIWSWILGCYLSDLSKKSYTIKHYIFGYIIYQINNLKSWSKLSLMEMRVLFGGFHSHWTEYVFFPFEAGLLFMEANTDGSVFLSFWSCEIRAGHFVLKGCCRAKKTKQ